MLNNRFCRHLSLPITLDTTELKSIQFGYSDIENYNVFNIDVDKSVVEFLKKEFSIDVTHAEVFYTPPFSNLPIHIDVDGSEIVKMNWVYGAENSKMVWYDLIDESQRKVMTTNIGTPYVLFDEENCVKIHSDSIDRPSLINAAIPHGITNDTNEGRWAVSYVLLDYVSQEKVTWVDASNRFKNFLKE